MDLFVEDRRGDETVVQRRLLKIEEICIPKSEVPAFVSKKISKPKKTSKLIRTQQAAPSPPTKPTPIFDIWGDQTAENASSAKKTEFVDHAVHPGASYNPTKKHHAQAMALALVREVNRSSTKIDLIDGSFETSSDTTGSREPEIESSIEPVKETKCRPSVPFVRKESVPVPQHQRLVRQRERMLRAETIKQKKQVQMLEQIEDIHKITSELIKTTSEKKDKRLPLNNTPKNFEPLMFPVFLNEELPSSLRTINTEPSGLFMDQFKKMQEKRLIEIKQSKFRKKKNALRSYEKRAYKDFDRTYPQTTS